MNWRELRPRVPIWLPITAVILIVLGLVAQPLIIENVSEETLARNVMISAAPFILVFLGILLLFITLIAAVASVLNGNISKRIYEPIERVAIAGILLGAAGLFQPWSFFVYRYSFLVLLISTLFFILWGHVVPRGARRVSELTSTSISEFEREKVLGKEQT